MSRQDSLAIRRVRPAEYGVTGDLIVEAYRTLGDGAGIAYEETLRDVAGRVASGEVLVAEIAGQVVGSVTYFDAQTELNHTDDPNAGAIRMLGVSQKARGHGVGEALVNACIDRAVASGRKHVRLSTRTSMKSAQRLYERLGFRRDPEHDWSPGPGINLLAYVLDLDGAAGFRHSGPGARIRGLA